jgi:outer membrane lipoprotein-sorting protein
MKRTLSAVLTFCLILWLPVYACGQKCRAEAPTDPNLAGVESPAAEIKDPNGPVNRLLSDMNLAAQKLRTCKARIDYLFVQDPELLDTRTFRKGILYYQKTESGSAVLIDFETVKQDDGPEQKSLERYFFDGSWLTKIDYNLKQTQKYQQAPEDKPMDVFEFIGHYFPIVGFSGAADIEKNFEASTISQSDGQKGLLLKTKQESPYRDEYTQAQLWIESRTGLPGRIVALSTQGDRYEIDFKDVRTNEKLPEKTFRISWPADFSVEVKPLENPEQ